MSGRFWWQSSELLEMLSQRDAVIKLRLAACICMWLITAGENKKWQASIVAFAFAPINQNLLKF